MHLLCSTAKRCAHCLCLLSLLRSNRCGRGPVHDREDDAELGLLAAADLNPPKARVLLLLALIAGLDRDDLAGLLSASHR